MFESLKCTLGRHSWGPWETERGFPCKTVRFCQICQTREVGFDRHTFSEWTREGREGACIDERSCIRCGLVETRDAEHRWSDWQHEHLESPSEKRVCLDCGRTEMRIGDYQWAEAVTIPQLTTPHVVVVDDDKLEQGVTEDLTAQTTDGAPVQGDELQTEPEAAEPMMAVAFEAPAPLAKSSVRKRQKKALQVPVAGPCEHAWGEWHLAGDNTCQLSRECSRCGQRDAETMVARHDLIWQQAPLPAPACLWIQRCQQCGHVETRETRHALVWSSKPGDPCTQEFRCEHCGHVEETQTSHHWFLTFRSERGTEHYTCEVCHKTRVQ